LIKIEIKEIKINNISDSARANASNISKTGIIKPLYSRPKGMSNLIDRFNDLEDSHVERTKRHKMLDIIFITLAAVISGAETWDEIEDYGDSSEPWLKEHLELPNGIPRHDTFNRLFASLDPLLLEKVFLDWVRDVCKLTKGELINIDGKALRGSSKRGSKSMVHMVSAWSSANQLSLGQYKVDGKSNEITAIPKLLEALTLEGCTVTWVAMGCQTEIAKAITEKNADYILATKGNQGTLGH